VFSIVSAAESKLSKAEQFALTRDGLSRDHPDGLMDGFFAAWPAVLFILAGKPL
jgi:hypothetical protein